jgi:hypothetical protein
MKIEYCLFACNDNEKYYKYYGYVREFWRKILGVKTLLVFIGDKLPEVLEKYRDEIIMFNIEGVHPVFIAQNIRLLYPALIESNEGIIIADIDILPLNKEYFVESIKDIENDKFIFINTTGNNITDEYYICYNIATPNVWGEVFKIKTAEDIKRNLKEWYTNIEYSYNDKYRSLCKGFHHDQIILKNKLVNFGNLEIINKKINRLVPSKYNYNNKSIYNKIIINNIVRELYKYDDYHINKELIFENELHNEIKNILLNI